MKEALVHGGALQAAIRTYGGARTDWLDLSTGINPCPPALPPVPPESWTRLPEAEDEARLCDAFRRFAGTGPEACIVAASGSGALIAALPHLVPQGTAVALRFTYGGHAKALESAGHAVVRVEDPQDLPADASLAFVANPNNPDGRRFAAAALLDIADRLAGRGGLLVVDEAFMDADPRESLASHAGRPGLVVLRSFGKTFGLAGLRLGFALVPPELEQPLRDRLGEWPVSGPAIAVGRALLEDGPGLEQLRRSIAQASAWTRRAIRNAGLEPTGDAALFTLVRHGRAPALFEALARRHVLVRPFAMEPDALRFGLCASGSEAESLGASLRDAVREIAA
ncbi:threonine-phosphate decarboxylase CobD [Aureimonas jatrophae]|uniref:threonine-phosphate decarboxylase n=1 Tax=Aureimonas jatrophae TaxID=1166073 RepID=A0A1H0D8I2_9HYPH|nr:threonine-phosphate decarboxylase CobD [Aureimonas jatrophae]MBB3951756.1 cobalamin biosynthetic protein CobC [Aureimonas jatrophae]SDN66418.1 L-threonine O-3-phosphate decarboxylase [Aureimonas jatrophae]